MARFLFNNLRGLAFFSTCFFTVAYGWDLGEYCQHDGGFYDVGEEIPVGPESNCASCYCSETAEVKCWGQNCETLKCVDFETRPGDCCPTCPTGDNCWMNGNIIPAYQTAIDNSAGCIELCNCPFKSEYEIHGKDTQANCRSSCKRDNNI